MKRVINFIVIMLIATLLTGFASFEFLEIRHIDGTDYLSSYEIETSQTDGAINTSAVFSTHAIESMNSTNDIPSNTILTLSFFKNGGFGTMASQSFVSGQAQAIKPNTFMAPYRGIAFGGWSTTPSGAVVYKNSEVVTISQTLHYMPFGKLFIKLILLQMVALELWLVNILLVE